MSCSGISPRDIRNYLEGFCLESTDTATFTSTFLSGVTEITLVGAVTDLKENMSVSGDGIATGTVIEAVNYNENKITLSIATTSDQTDVSLSVIFYTALTDDWLINRRDRFIVPWIARHTIVNPAGVQEKTEYVSGNGLTTLILSRRPIVEVLELSYVNAPGGEEFEIVNSIEIDKEQGILMSRNRIFDATSYSAFRRGVKNIRVRYTYGFADVETEAPDICEAITSWLAKEALVLIGNRSGGGDVNLPGYNRTFGPRGKYTHIINELDRKTHSILSGYFDGIGAP